MDTPQPNGAVFDSSEEGVHERKGDYMAKKDEYSKGDWIVHLHYGVGQIKSAENKLIDNIKTEFYKVKTDNSMFWVPVIDPDVTRVRPVSSKYMMRKAITTLKETPDPLPDDHNERKRQINNQMREISFIEIAKLLRDLIARQSASRLNPSEEKAMETIKANLLLEWSVIMDWDMEKVTDKFQEVITHIQEAAVA
jgi:RNA polymerase-interacting CarD/CdnL/TRCF family regulator